MTQSDRLVTFHSDSPGAIRATTPIRGLRGGEDIVGIDVRRSDGLLYGVTSAGRLHTIAVRAGVARPVVPAAFGGLDGARVGFDFDPIADELRLVTDAGANFRVNADTGQPIDADPTAAGVQRDGDLAYASADPAVGASPRVEASAYRGGRLFGIDTARETLVAQTPPNGGVLSTIGRLGVKTGSSVEL